MERTGVTSRFAQNCTLRWHAQTAYLSARFGKRVLQQKILDSTFGPQTFQIPPDTVGEFAGLAESSTYAGKSARIAASIRTETGALSFFANHNAKYKRLLPPY